MRGMKLLPHEIWITALILPGPKRYGITLPTKAEAIKKLREKSGQDFGEDAAKWKAWFKKHPTGRQQNSNEDPAGNWQLLT